MSFEFEVTPGPQHTRVALTGQAHLGQLLSLLQLLHVDSAAWPSEAALLDLSELQVSLTQADRVRLQEEAVRMLARIHSVTVLWNRQG